MFLHSFYDNDTATFTYIVADNTSKKCAVIDAVLDYDPVSDHASTISADALIDFIQKNNLDVEWILETHVHADHLTAATYIKNKLGGKIAIGSQIQSVLSYWDSILNRPTDGPLTANVFDKLFDDNDSFQIGTIPVTVLHTPGHTPACVSYLIQDCVFVGDVIFHPTLGTARADFPGGDAKILYQSIQKILSLPDETKIYWAHDYPEAGHLPRSYSTVLEQKRHNILVNETIDEEQFIILRTQRDQGKPPPRLMMCSLKVNLRAGDLSQTSCS